MTSAASLFEKKAQGHFEFIFQVEAFFALGNIPDCLVDMNVGCSSQFFLLCNCHEKGILVSRNVKVEGV